MTVTQKKTVKKGLNLAFVSLSFLIILMISLKSGDVSKTRAAIKAINLPYILACFGCFLTHMWLEGYISYVFFRFQKVKTTVLDNLHVGLIGMYYSSITPAATGGQPMQVYAYVKRGIGAGVASSAMAVKFFSWQCAVLLLGAVMWASHLQFVQEHMMAGVWLLRIGFFVNALTVVAVCLLAVSPKFVHRTMTFFVRLSHRLRLVKDADAAMKKWDHALQDFYASVRDLLKRPLQFMVLLCLSMVQVVAMMSVIYFVYKGFHLNERHYLELLTMQLMLFIAASMTPLPGASGAQEGGFYLFFASFFSSETIFAAMFIWRFFTYYMSILTGFLGVVLESWVQRRG